MSVHLSRRGRGLERGRGVSAAPEARSPVQTREMPSTTTTMSANDRRDSNRKTEPEDYLAESNGAHIAVSIRRGAALFFPQWFSSGSGFVT